ncbi:hypothetical protein NDU88_011907 [Pleurodeles waltl]|uniref:Uncharacterized protein n=1 Tax=Pleurodeles waltl TaxID=8319 RepID=A0AAV7QZ60_PLEWA|nr:hypothetical protein NDU88_011907 [Pleurodeles waltl]
MCVYFRRLIWWRYARGVAVLLRRGLQWRMHRVIVDPNGRYVLLGGTLLDRPCLLVLVYGPNVDDPGFFYEVWHLVESLGSGAVIGGEILMWFWIRRGTGRVRLGLGILLLLLLLLLL